MSIRPSRFTATPAEVDAWLREHFAEDVLLGYQQAIGNGAVSQATAEQLAYSCDRSSEFTDGVEWAAWQVNPESDGGPWPGKLITFKNIGIEEQQ